MDSLSRFPFGGVAPHVGADELRFLRCYISLGDCKLSDWLSERNDPRRHRRRNLLALVVWMVGTFCLPVTFLFHGEIERAFFHTGLLSPLRSFLAFFPGWILLIVGPCTALLAITFMRGRKKHLYQLALLPVMILFFAVTIRIAAHIAYLIWTNDHSG